MRRSLGLLIVVVALGIGSSTAFAATKETVTIKALIGAASWEDVNEDTGAGEVGDIQFATTGRATTVSLFISKGELVLCEGADTDDPTDDIYGFVGTETSGEGQATLKVGRTYSSATAKGTVKAEVSTFDECTGDEGTVTTRTISIALTLDGISPVITEKLHSTISIPRQLRSKTLAQSRSREAAGTATVGSRSIEVGGAIGQLQMRSMTKER